MGRFQPEVWDEVCYCSSVWHDDLTERLSSDYGGWPMVTHWAPLPPAVPLHEAEAIRKLETDMTIRGYGS